jgi:predicted GIY-YIG superfamily endonuclease
MWNVYFLRLSNNDIYVGSTNDLRRASESRGSEQLRPIRMDSDGCMGGRFR